MIAVPFDHAIKISPEHLALLIDLWVRSDFSYPHGVTDHAFIRLSLEDLILRGEISTLRVFLERSGLKDNAEVFRKLFRMTSALPSYYDAKAFIARYDRHSAFDYISGMDISDVLIIVFTGSNQRVGFPLPLVHGLFETSGCPVLYLKDRSRKFFCDGLGDGDSRDALIARIRQKMEHEGIRRSILFGCSSGTFAALQYAQALSASHVMGMAGPTWIDPADARSQIQGLRAKVISSGLPLDAVEALGRTDSCMVRYYYGENHVRDGAYGRHLVESGAGDAVAVRGTANHIVFDIVSELGLFQADLAAAVSGLEYTEASAYPEVSEPFRVRR